MTQMTLSYALSSWIVSSSSGNIIVTMMKSDKAVRTRMNSSKALLRDAPAAAGVDTDAPPRSP